MISVKRLHAIRDRCLRSSSGSHELLEDGILVKQTEADAIIWGHTKWAPVQEPHVLPQEVATEIANNGPLFVHARQDLEDLMACVGRLEAGLRAACQRLRALDAPHEQLERLLLGE